MGRELVDLTGRQFGRLTVLREASKRGRNRYWICRCECGNDVSVFQGDLLSGQSGCSCKLKEARIAINKAEEESLRRKNLRKEMKAAGYLK